jgi:hypothetical protein
MEASQKKGVDFEIVERGQPENLKISWEAPR